VTPVLAVIVPTVVGLGLLVSLLVLVRDAWERLRGPGWMSRRCGHQGRAAAAMAAGPPRPPGSRRPTTRERAVGGLRDPWWYLLAAALLVAVSLWALIGSWGNYIGWQDWLEGISWLFLVFIAAGAAAAVLAVACLVLMVRGPRMPAWVAALTARTPLGVVPAGAPVSTTVVEHPRHRRRARGDAAPPVRPLGRHHVSDEVAAWARGIAGIWTVLAVGAIGWVTITDRIPTAPEELDNAIARPVWITLYALLVLAALTVYRWEVAGSIALAVAAGALAVMSSLQYGPFMALALTTAFAVPAFLHWLAWQRDHHVHRLLRVGAFTFVLIGTVWVWSDRVYAHYFGPTHPESATVLVPAGDVEWAWAGATTSRSTTVVARTADPAGRVRLAMSTSPALSDPIWSPPGRSTEQNHLVTRLDVEGLQPDTAYWWAVEVDGRLDRARSGRMRTMPEGPASFSLAVSACARSRSNGAVFDTIRGARPLAFLILGDLHYANIADDDPGRFRDALDLVLSAPGQSALYRSTSTAYVWDDHDYSDNDGDASSASRPAAHQVYRAWVPHHPLVGDGDSAPIGQSFVAGRVRVVMTDTRSDRSPPDEVAPPERDMLGPRQEAWFADELAAARAAGQVVLWASTSPWIGAANPTSDTWAGYDASRRRVADLIVAAGMQDRLVMVAGDAHMVALDDGTNTDYSSSGAGGFPLLQAAALDRPGSVKGGPYSGGTYPGGGQYGEVEVADVGGPRLEVTLRGLTWQRQLLVERTFSLPVG
jgi:hypothetical protein